RGGYRNPKLETRRPKPNLRACFKKPTRAWAYGFAVPLLGSPAPFRRRDAAGTRRRGRLRYVARASGRRVLAASRRQKHYENTLPKAWEQGFGLQFLTASP